MQVIHQLGKVLVVCVAGAAITQASDYTGVYARIDKVVVEPATGAPERIEVWGVFSLPDPANRQDYLAPARGYLYFKLDRNPEAARAEWNDLKAVAGTGEIVAFGARTAGRFRLRKADEKPDNPDPYVTNVGVNRVGRRTDYPPIRALLDYKD